MVHTLTSHIMPQIRSNMAKRKRGGPQKAPERPSEYEDRTAARFKHDTYEGVANSEDEFHMHRDKIMIEDQPESKKAKQRREEGTDGQSECKTRTDIATEAFLDPSDEEILGYSASSSESGGEDYDDQEQDADAAADEDDEAASAALGVEEDDLTNWGASKSAYYNTDAITTEQEAIDEEIEARRIQQKRLQALSVADFGFDEDAWVGQAEDVDGGDEEDDEGGVVYEKLPQLQVTPQMGAEERLTLLKKRYPDFERFAQDLVALQPVWETLKVDVKNAEADAASAERVYENAPVALTNFRALSAYLGALSMYFAILTSPAQKNEAATNGETNGVSASTLPLPPTELREHGILESVKQAQTTWEQVQHLQPPEEAMSDVDASDDEELSDAESLEEAINTKPQPNGHNLNTATASTKHQPATDARSASLARRAARLARTEASLALLPSHLTFTPSTNPHKTPKPTTQPDTGDEPPPLPHQTAQKAAHRKSLRFYTSQIAQKELKREGAKARALAGDEDLPYQERWRDRVARLNREAGARGRGGEELDGRGSDEDGDGDGHEEEEMDVTDAQRERDGDMSVQDADYASLTSRALAKKHSKSAARTASSNPNTQPLGTTYTTDPTTSRRHITHQIDKNRGLTPKRKKENKNPRVKKRRKFEDKTKKLRSMKPTFKAGGEGRGGYGGELTGIKGGVSRSVRF